MRIYNTLTRQLEELRPIEPGHVRMYTCGPTVYNFAHIGNLRAYVFEDLLRRTIRYNGCRVTQVMNLTDVDDKTIKGARQAGIPLRDFTRTYKDAFFQDLKAINIEPAEHYPAATDHVPAMIDLIGMLLAKGVAYRSVDGSIYFSIAKFPGYGKLAHLDMVNLQPGARVAQDEYEKENLADFALWKAWDELDGDVAWESPWGRGRPGWHIECSAMGMQYLGPSFDLHTGGIDNMFPHHEDEIAQSEAATGSQFVRYWMHCAHLVVDGRKMSKSLGNFFTLRDLLKEGFTGREVRYVLASAHYRQALNFTFDALRAARASLARIDEFRARLTEYCAGATPADGDLPEWVQVARAAITGAWAEDLGMPESLGALFDLIHAGNRALDARTSPTSIAAAITLIDDLDRVYGFLAPVAATPDVGVEALLAARQAARKGRDFPEADRLRAAIEAAGWIIQDTPTGPKLKRK